MTDHRLTTRDLAARSDSTEADSSLETERPTARSSGAGTAREPAPETGGGVSDAAMRRDPAGDHPSDTRAGAEAREGHQPLFAPDQSERFTSRWRDIQTSFVDQPRDAVAEADALVADLMQRLAGSFSQ